MSHEEMRDRLLDLLYGELPPRAARKVEEHAASCEACGAELARMRSTRGLMSSLPPEPAPEGGERILLAAAREAARRRAPRPWLPRWAWATALAASLVAVGAVSYRIVAMRPGGIGREDTQALMGDSPYARAPQVAVGTGEAGPAGAPAGAPEQRPAPVPEEGDRAERRRKAEAPVREAAPPRFAVPPPPSPPSPPRRETDEAAARPSPSPPRSGGEGRGEGAAAAPAPRAQRKEALRAEEGPPPSAAREMPDEAPTAARPPAAAAPGRAAAAPRPEAKAAAQGAPAAVLRYQELRASGGLRGEVQTFPGCDGEQWRKVERDPGGRIVSYAREGLLDGRRVRVDVVYGPDGAPVRVTVKDAATSAPLAGASPWVPRAAEADGPPRCGP